MTKKLCFFYFEQINVYTVGFAWINVLLIAKIHSIDETAENVVSCAPDRIYKENIFELLRQKFSRGINDICAERKKEKNYH